jgi:hypothetical protein
VSQIVRISVYYMYETCERHSYYVRATTDEDLHKDVDGHCTGSVYNNFEGIDREEARDRALMDALVWGDFLGITPDPYVEDGVTYEPSMNLSTYSYQRERRAKS